MKSIDKHSLRKVDLLNGLGIYSTNLGINGQCGLNQAFPVVLTCAQIYNECSYAPLGGDHNAVPVCDNDRR